MHKLIQNSPPGINLESELRYFFGGMIGAFLYSLGFAIRFHHAYDSLFQEIYGRKYLVSGAAMPEFSDLFRNSHYGYLVITLSMIGLAVIHYACHYQGSKSIYLMRRLSDPWELYRRCLYVPALGVAVSLAAAVITVTVDFAVYMLVTPETVLPPNQWQKLWSVLI